METRQNFINKQEHIHVISFNNLSGEELYELYLLVHTLQVALTARKKHVHIFHR
jgi:hypothetical protein